MEVGFRVLDWAGKEMIFSPVAGTRTQKFNEGGISVIHPAGAASLHKGGAVAIAPPSPATDLSRGPRGMGGHHFGLTESESYSSANSIRAEQAASPTPALVG